MIDEYNAGNRFYKGNKLIHYKVSIHKGKETRILAIDEHGKILRERK
jgi:hypothetical protein